MNCSQVQWSPASHHSFSSPRLAQHFWEVSRPHHPTSLPQPHRWRFSFSSSFSAGAFHARSGRTHNHTRSGTGPWERSSTSCTDLPNVAWNLEKAARPSPPARECAPSRYLHHRRSPPHHHRLCLCLQLPLAQPCWLGHQRQLCSLHRCHCPLLPAEGLGLPHRRPLLLTRGRPRQDVCIRSPQLLQKMQTSHTSSQVSSLARQALVSPPSPGEVYVFHPHLEEV
mmetsp:Transcript_19635/g.45727  ORF Transcript_19635/g.45727 Transcript_19635/m.45727 type:complete len:225 (-) Transcript_19635:386-1060(-)